MAKQLKRKIFDQWADKVRERVGDHAFASPQVRGGKSLLDSLLEAIYRKHFLSAYKWVEPPLQGFPRMPLDHRWVELRLRAENEATWFRGVRIDGKPAGALVATQSVHPLLSSADCCAILGLPGSGKSTMLRWAAQYMIREPRLTSIVPIFIPLRSYIRGKEGHDGEDLYGFFWTSFLQLPERFATEFRQFMEDVEGGSGPRRNLCRVLLDGWDEVPSRFQGTLLSAFERFEFTLPAILTSRPVGFVSRLPPWPRYSITPLTFNAMRNLMREWYSNIERPELETVTCTHLGRHVGLRDLARNPFILTLLCAVVARRQGRLPTTRCELYRDALTLTAKYCEEHKHEHGMGFDLDTMWATEVAAYALLKPLHTTTYEFNAADVRRVAADNGRLFKTWKAARLIQATNEYQGSFSFQHSTVHEYLAAQELGRRIARGDVRPDELGFDPALLNLFTFAFGSVEGGWTNELWFWLKQACANLDRFGIIVVKAAHWLAEAGEQDGGSARIGMDVLEPLWKLFLASPAPRRYAEALVALDADWTIRKAPQALEQDSSIAVHRLPLLLRLISVENPGRAELMELTLKIPPKKPATSLEVDVEQELGESLFDGPLELTKLDNPWSESELIAAARKEKDPILLQALLSQVALFRGTEGERFLVDELKNARGNKNAAAIVRGLEVLGTVSACEALLDSVETLQTEPILLRRILSALANFPIQRHADRLLALVHGTFPNDIRIASAVALGNTEEADVLNRLVVYARLSEPDADVRRTVIGALGRAKFVSFVRVLWDERQHSQVRKGDEWIVCLDYLGAIARHISATRDYGGYFKNVESLLLDAITKPAEGARIAIQRAAELRGSKKIIEALETIVRDPSRKPSERAAALESLGEMDAAPASNELVAWLDEAALKPEYSDVVASCAKILARVAPERLLRRKDLPSTMALWRLSLESDALVYEDHIVYPGRQDQESSQPRESAGSSASSTRLKSGKGRPSIDPIDPAREQQITDAWATKRYEDYADLGRAFDMSRRQIERLMNRIQKRNQRQE